MNFDEKMMKRALGLAKIAFEMDEVPVGCVITKDGEVIGEGKNIKESECDATAHAEIIAIREAAKKTGSWRLDGTTLYVTCEPCPMCAGAIVHARISRVVFGCRDPKGGGILSLYTIGTDGKLNHNFNVTPDILSEECSKILKNFFQKKRNKDEV